MTVKANGKTRCFFAVLLAVLMLLSSASILLSNLDGGANGNNKSMSPPDVPAASAAEQPVYVGVTFCGNTTAEAKVLIDRVETYTNLFVLLSGPVSKNETSTNEICDYAVAARMHVIVYFGLFDPAYPWQVPWLDFAKQRWGEKFLGVWYYDEPGGIQIDYNWTARFSRMKMLNTQNYQLLEPAIEAYLNGSGQTRNYDVAASLYVNFVKNDSGIRTLENRSITIFTSDYALYLYTYEAGFDVLLTQFGWNDSITQDIDLTRAAAQMQNKSWGAIVTWKYDVPPYLDTGDEIYKQMVMAYDAGAKYVTIFNYANDSDGTHAIMLDEHFGALQKFWSYIHGTPTPHPTADKADAVLILPRNYGFGMRRPDDRIWYWGSDSESTQIWEKSRELLTEYGTKLDIVYDDPAFPVNGKYAYVYYWNSTF